VKKSWASEELALQDIGRLISAEFSKDFFLQYFVSNTKKVRLRFSGLPASAAARFCRRSTQRCRYQRHSRQARRR